MRFLKYFLITATCFAGAALAADQTPFNSSTISGLGAIIINSANNFDTATMFVPLIVLMVLATGLNSLIGLIERKVAPWQVEIAGREQQ